MDEAIIQYIKRKYNLLIGERTAELIKITIGSAYPGNEIQTMEIKGRDLVAGVPKTVEIIGRGDPRSACSSRSTRSSRRCASRSSARRRSSPPTSSTRASCSRAAARCCATSTCLLREETGLPVMLAEDPLTAVVMGAGKVLDELSLLKDVTIQ